MAAYYAMRAEMLRGAADLDSSFLGGMTEGMMGIPKGAQSREITMQSNEADPEGVVREYYRSCKSDVGHVPGELFTVKTYGDATLSDKFHLHTTLWRAWLMSVAVEQRFAQGQARHARMQNINNLKALHRALRADGKWAEAWGYTYLPELHETTGGASMAERATTGRWLREKSALETALNTTNNSSSSGSSSSSTKPKKK